jgi:hypothetical protein
MHLSWLESFEIYDNVELNSEFPRSIEIHSQSGTSLPERLSSLSIDTPVGFGLGTDQILFFVGLLNVRNLTPHSQSGTSLPERLSSLSIPNTKIRLLLALVLERIKYCSSWDC